MQEQIVLKTQCDDLKLASRGKVRDIYDLGDTLLMVCTDRLSAFDVVMSQGIPHKGEVLTRLSAFWFACMEQVVPNHLLSTDVEDFPAPCRKYADKLAGRSMLVRKAQPLSAECIVRGYITGSGWKEYKQTGSICGISLPEGLKESEAFPEPLFTPSTKAEVGAHDENIRFEKVCEIIGRQQAEKVRDLSVKIYEKARGMAGDRGIIIADTKMEFGIYNGEIMLIDELLTPDSSRFWPKDEYAPGRPQMSFDKQFVRDYLSSLDWDKTPPPPELPEDIITKTSLRYIEAFERLTGQSFQGR